MEINLILLSIIRFVVPLTIFRWPLLGFALSMMADTIDFQFLPHTTPQEVLFYNQWDKFFDIYFLAIAFYTTLRWKDKLAKKWAKILFGYRMIGVILFELTNLRYLLFIFPNLFDYFYLFYMLNRFLLKRDVVFAKPSVLYFALLLLLIPKLAQEFFIHIKQQMPWQQIAIPILGQAGLRDAPVNQAIWMLAYDALLIAVLVIKFQIADEQKRVYKNIGRLTKRITTSRLYPKILLPNK